MPHPIRILAIALLVLAGTAPGALAAPPITEFPSLPTASSDPDKIVTGPDGNLWFTEFGNDSNAIGHARPDGSLINEFPIPTTFADAEGITVGPDGNIWFAESGRSKLGVVRSDGSVHDFATTTANSEPLNVISGPGGELWFTEGNTNMIGRMTTTGAPDGEFQATTPSSRPFDLALGPDGNIWFTEANASKIGVMSPTGTMLHEYPTPTANADPLGIVPGPDGNMWVAEDQSVARVTPDGAITEFHAPTAGGGIVYLTAGPDRNIWFAENQQNRLGLFDLATGAISDFPVPTANSGPYGITTGPDCNVWFTEIADSPDGNRLGRVELGGCPKPPVAPAPTPPAAPSSGRAKIALAARAGLINTRSGRGTWLVICRNVGADQCRISLSLKVTERVGKLAARAKLVSIGTVKGTVAGGKAGLLRVRLTRKGRALLAAKKRLKATASGRSRNRAGVSVTVHKRVALKAKPRHAKR